MDRNISFCMFVIAFIVLCSSSFTSRYKVYGFDVPTRYQQCKLRGFDMACLSCDTSCVELRCGRLRADGHFMEVAIIPHGGVLKGTKCGEGKMCVNRQCVHPVLEFPRYIGNDEYDECKPAHPITVTYTRSSQCQRHGLDGVCEGYSSACAVLHCARKHNNLYYSQRIMPRWGVEIGTYCGENKICINHKCVDVVGEMPTALGGDNIHDCMQVQPSPSQAVKTRHEQCLAHGFDVACKDEHRTPDAKCRLLRCGYEMLPGIYFEPAQLMSGANKMFPTTGTTCGEFHTCQKRKCKATTPAEMPTYTGNEIYRDCYTTNRHDRAIIPSS